MTDFLFRGSLADLDPSAHKLTQIECERQVRKIILIPSESAAPLAVREALASVFQNIYAEGYPDEESRLLTEADILDYEERLAHYRRFSDPRYYKGVEYADIVEMLARRRCAELFATQDTPADRLYVNVQPLSGAPANNAVYHALVQPGETVMGMNLLHGGHLTHGSTANRSGKLYHSVPYQVDPKTERIDYDAVEALVKQHQPKMIIAGYSSYPWSVDWRRFRAIADAVGAYLVADIAHVAGLVAAGVHPSPVGIADVITFTTHKSLCGPRGAVILTHSRKLAKLLDRAVFPGEQGGPHLSTMLAQAVTFRLAATTQFKELQKQIILNCCALTAALEKAGFRIPFGGTDSHLTNLDCKSVVGPDGTALSGDMAARILDLGGIVVNRNTIPGDVSAGKASGIRMGTPWITQRGFREPETEAIASLIANLLRACTPYEQAGRKGELVRARVDFDVLHDTQIKARELALSMGIDIKPTWQGDPHFFYMDDRRPRGRCAVIEISGEMVEPMLRWATNVATEVVDEGQTVSARVSTPRSNPRVTLTKGHDRWTLTVPASDAVLLVNWLRDLSDGYVAVDPADPLKRLPGPVRVRLQGTVEAMPASAEGTGADTKPWFVGIRRGAGRSLPKFTWREAEGEIRRTALNQTHRDLGARMVPFAGWDMPVWYTSVVEEHLATRQAAGLFDVSHMGVYMVEGSQACAFLDSVATNDVSALAVGESLYAQFLEPEGSVLDDTMIYRVRDQAYLVVVNASNDDKDRMWLTAVQEGAVRVDGERPWTQAPGRGCTIRNLRDPGQREGMRVDIALQGPRSLDILLMLEGDAATKARLKAMPWAGVMEATLGGFDLIVTRTGYTGERVAYELFIHPEKSVELWKKLLAIGSPLGLKPVGLGARDSLRTEAGLPLYGHEMAGPLGLTVGDSGFGSYVKTHKPWFVGRQAFLEQEKGRQGEVVRFRFDEKGVRMAHLGDPVVDRRGRVIGKVTSCAVDRDGFLLGQAYLERKYTEEGAAIAVFQSASKERGKAPAELVAGDRVGVPTPATVLSRFPRRDG